MSSDYLELERLRFELAKRLKEYPPSRWSLALLRLVIDAVDALPAPPQPGQPARLRVVDGKAVGR